MDDILVVAFWQVAVSMLRTLPWHMRDDHGGTKAGMVAWQRQKMGAAEGRKGCELMRLEKGGLRGSDSGFGGRQEVRPK